MGRPAPTTGQREGGSQHPGSTGTPAFSALLTYHGGGQPPHLAGYCFFPTIKAQLQRITVFREIYTKNSWFKGAVENLLYRRIKRFQVGVISAPTGGCGIAGSQPNRDPR